MKGKDLDKNNKHDEKKVRRSVMEGEGRKENKIK